MSTHAFAEFFKKTNISYKEQKINGIDFLVMEGYTILHGKHASKTVDIAMEIPPDFPDTPPYGIHIKKNHEFETVVSVNPSALGEEWEHWSRQMEWNVPDMRTPQYCMDHINRWLELE